MKDLKDLEKLAEEGQVELEERAQKKREVHEKAQHKEARRTQSVLGRSLGLPRVWAQLRDAVVIFSAVGALVCLLFVTSPDGGLWAGVAAGGLVLFAGGLYYATVIVWPRRQIQWLKSLPFEFDLDAYHGMLQERHYTRRLLVTVFFKEPLSEEVAKLAGHAVTGALPGWSGRLTDSGALLIRGKPLRTWFIRGKTSVHESIRTINDNSNVHAEFRRCVRQFLIPFSKLATIAKVMVRAPQDVE